MRPWRYMARLASGIIRGDKAMWQAVVVRMRLAGRPTRTVCLRVALVLVSLAAALCLPGDSPGLPGDVIRYGVIHYFTP